MFLIASTQQYMWGVIWARFVKMILFGCFHLGFREEKIAFGLILTKMYDILA